MTTPTRQIAGTFTDSRLNPAAGKKIKLIPQLRRTDTVNKTLIDGDAVEVVLDSAGKVPTSPPVLLVCSDGAGVQPAPVAYVLQKLFGDRERTDPFNIPSGSGALDLADVVPLGAAPTPAVAYWTTTQAAAADAAVLAAAEAYTDAHAGQVTKAAVIATGVAATDLGGMSSAQITTAITTAVNNLINGAPGALDTLNELATALGDDANFAATVTTALAGKQPLDADLTAIAALTTTAFGRALLTMADAAATKTALSLVKGDVGLGNVDNTADTAKPVSAAQAAADSAVQTAAAADATAKVSAQHTADVGLFAPVSTTTIDLVDRTNNTTETVPAGTTTNCSTAGVTKTAPALDNPVATPPKRFAIKNLSTGSITVAYPDQSGAAQSLTMLTGETRTFRQKSTSGWGVESGALALSTLDGRFAPITGSAAYAPIQRVAPGLNLYNAKGLRRWHQKLGDALFTRAPIHVCGDSLVYGQGADGVNGTGSNSTDAVQGWPGQLRTVLAKTYGDPGEGFWFPDDSRITQTGTPIGVAQYGVMRHGRRLLSTQSLTFTIPTGITTVGIVQYNNSGDVSAVYTKNGGSSSNVATLTGTGVPLETEIACTAGDVFVVTGPASAQTYIVGLVMRTGTTGVPVHRMGQPGYVIGDLLGGQTTGVATLSSANQALAIGAAYRWAATPGLLILSYGINDQVNAGNTGATGAVTAALYQTWLTQVCTQAVADGWAVLIVGEPPAYNPSTAVAGSTEADYRAAQLAVALSMDHVAYLDTKDVLGTNAQANTGGLNFASSVHLTRRGYGVVARTVLRAVLEPLGENAPAA